jgi:mono/diheme cytochrome c family protein
VTTLADDEGRVLTWVLAWLGLTVAGLGIAVGVGCGTRANACPFRKSAPLTSTDGRTIFLSTCAACHGVDARGGRGPDLLGPPISTYDLQKLMSAINNGKPLAGMPAFGKPSLGGQRLSPEQIRAVAQYLIDLRGGPTTSPGASG